MMGVFGRNQTDCDKRIVREWDWHSMRNGEVRAVITEWEEGRLARDDLEYQFSVAFYGNSRNYPCANGKHVWIRDYKELEVFLENVADKRVPQLCEDWSKNA